MMAAFDRPTTKCRQMFVHIQIMLK